MISQKISRIVIALLAIIIGLYPSMYFFKERTFGLLSSKPNELLVNSLWNTAFYTHIILGGVALLLGWLQFSPKIRLKNISLHRAIGKIYIVSALISSLASIGLGFFATGGGITSIGFICLGIIWFATTLLAYLKIKSRQVEPHRRLMIYSYAACFSAVMLRIWLPFLIILFGDFIVAYSIVAWLCWVPNLLVANLIIRKLKPYQT
jgi:uncharacterized membrane protein